MNVNNKKEHVMPFPPIKKIFSIINSCYNENQLRSCVKLANNYTRLVQRSGVVNYGLVRETLLIKIKERMNELKLTNEFKGKIRRKKIKVEEFEKELVESFQ